MAYFEVTFAKQASIFTQIKSSTSQHQLATVTNPSQMLLAKHNTQLGLVYVTVQGG